MTEEERSSIFYSSLLIAKNQSLEDLPDEEWRPVVGYEDLYQVSNLGRVKSIDRHTLVVNDPRSKPYFRHHRARILTQRFNDDGYLVVGLSDNNKGVQRLVHRLVYQVFVCPSLEFGDRENTVNHKNTVKTDNRVDNLEVMSRLENTHDFYTNPDFEVIRQNRIEKLRKASTGVRQSQATIDKRLNNLDRKKMSNSLKEYYKKNPEAKAHLSNLRKGSHLSQEHKNKISQANKARVKKVRCVETGEVFSSLEDCATRYKVHVSTICAIISGGVKNSIKCNNHHFAYVDDTIAAKMSNYPIGDQEKLP